MSLKVPHISASVLAANFANIKDEVTSVTDAGVDSIHIDVMDGSFVPPITFGDNMVSAIKHSSSLFRETHLMIVNPEKHIKSFADAGSQRIIVHVEATHHIHKVVNDIKALGISAGVAINPGTTLESVYDILSAIDLLLIMTVNPGWGGQKFIPDTLEKIKKARTLINSRGLSTLIEVDGGINKDTIKPCFDAGVDLFVVGSALFSTHDRAETVKKLKNSV